MIFRSLLALAVLLRLAAGPAAAQPSSRMFEDTLTVGDPSRCAVHRYEVAKQAGALVFRNQDNKVNVETIVDRRFDRFSTLTILSGQVQPGTRWDYQQAGAHAIQVRNLALGRTFTLARCPEYGAAASRVANDNGPASSLAFMQTYFATWSSDNQTALAFGASHYLPDVIFYGKSTPRGTIMQQKDAFVRRWPIRSYVIVPDSVATRCGSDGCEISGIVDWTCRSIERGAVSSGTATFTLRLVRQGAATMIALEDGAVAGRRAQGQFGNQPPPGTSSQPPPIRPAPLEPLQPPQVDIPPPRL